MTAVCSHAGEASGVRDVVNVAVIRSCADAMGDDHGREGSTGPTTDDGAGTAEGDEHGSWTEREALHAPVLGAGQGQSELNTPSDGVRSGQGGGRKRCGCGAHARRENVSFAEQPSDDVRSRQGGGRRRCGCGVHVRRENASSAKWEASRGARVSLRR
ncbi:hypothetical protein GUJ93_ZPchr0002g23424 [Zizania palustris]|uniref:Uncharacterized protein n=1 Tax=Zizania palustris TaxID=103762 RepID=A0A8J5S482_ZIZPA|nr:hypothetical protein GUJ93_ZPchr0002g23424 [Zizania palustris]